MIDYKKLPDKDLEYMFKNIDWKTKPTRHQLVAYAFALGEELNEIVFWYGLATGKTKIGLDLSWLWGCKKILAVVPSNVIRVWREEISLHSDFTFTELTGSQQNRIDNTKLQRNVYLINYEGLKYLFGIKKEKGDSKKFIVDLNAFQNVYKFDCLICDELHRLKSIKSVQVRIVQQLSLRIKYKIFLGATPISKSEMDLWAEYWCLDNGKSLGSNFYSFRNTYFFQAGFKWLPKRECPICKRLFSGMKRHLESYHPEITLKQYNDEYRPDEKNSVERILKRIQPVTIRYATDECMDLPKKTYKKLYVPMSKEQRKITNQLIAGYNGEINDKILTETNALERTGKLAQVTGGFLYEQVDGKRNVRRFEENPKLDCLEETIDEILINTNKILVFHRFAEEGRMIAELLKQNNIGYAELRGETKDKDENYRRFKKDKDCRVLIAHPACGGEGLNLFEANVVIFYSNTYEGATVREQAEGRIRRPQQTKTCIYIDVFAEDSIDEIIFAINMDKKATAKLILDYIGRKPAFK